MKIGKALFTVLCTLAVFFAGCKDQDQKPDTFGLIKAIELKSGEYIHKASFSPDGKTIMCRFAIIFGEGVEEGQYLAFYSVPDGEKLRYFPDDGKTVDKITFSPDGRKFALVTDDGRIKILDADNGKELQSFSGPEEDVDLIEFSPDGTKIATVHGWWSEAIVKIWDTESGKEVKALSYDDGFVAFSPNSKMFLAIIDGASKLFDAESGKELQTLSGQGWFLAFSPNGKKIALSTDSGITIQDAANGKELQTLSINENEYYSAVFSPNGLAIALYSYINNTIAIWDAVNGKELQTLSGHEDGIESVAFSADGKKIVTCSSDSMQIWGAVER